MAYLVWKSLRTQHPHTRYRSHPETPIQHWSPDGIFDIQHTSPRNCGSGVISSSKSFRLQQGLQECLPYPQLDWTTAWASCWLSPNGSKNFHFLFFIGARTKSSMGVMTVKLTPSSPIIATPEMVTSFAPIERMRKLTVLYLLNWLHQSLKTTVSPIAPPFPLLFPSIAFDLFSPLQAIAKAAIEINLMLFP